MGVDEDKELRSRVMGLEDDVKDLTKTMGALEADVKNVARAMGTITDSLDRLTSNVQHQSKTDWNVLGVWAGIIISVVTALGYLANQPQVQMLARHEISRAKQWDRITRLEKEILNRKAQNNITETRLDFVQKEVDAIREEQSRRTEKVYKRPVRIQ